MLQSFRCAPTGDYETRGRLTDLSRAAGSGAHGLHPAAGMKSEQAERMRAWESAEISRSRVEAQLTHVGAGRLNARTRRRYENPPADTCFPLEYAYHLLGDPRDKTVLEYGCGLLAGFV